MSHLMLLTCALRRTVLRRMIPLCQCISNKSTYNSNYLTWHASSFVNVNERKLCSTSYIPIRHKYTKKADEDSSDSEDEIEEVGDVGQDFKVLKINVNSLRVDLILKAALGMARNKIEAAFYKSRVRINGHKLMKKSALIKTEDEIDLVRGTSKMNPEFLLISRVKILSFTAKEDKYSVIVQRFKTMTIENYPDDPLKTNDTIKS